MNRKNEIERFGDVLRQGGQLSVFVLKASVGKEIERLACLGTLPIVEHCFFLYVKKLVDEFDPSPDYRGIHPGYRVERYDLPTQELTLCSGDETSCFREKVYPQIGQTGLRPVDTIFLREAQFNLALKPETRSMQELRDHYINLNKYIHGTDELTPADIERLRKRYASSTDRFLLPGQRMMRLRTTCPKCQKPIQRKNRKH